MSNKYLKHTAFTLAEVLITLGIIGVVAAMTIPTLIANTNSQRFRSQFKKTISTLSQAARMNMVHYDFDFAGVNADCTAVSHDLPSGDKPDEIASKCSIFNANLTGITYYKVCPDGTCGSLFDLPSITYPAELNLQEDDDIAIGLADGSVVVFSFMSYAYQGDNYVCTTVGNKNSIKRLTENWCGGYIDVNGTSGPNKVVTCSDGKDTKVVGDTGYEPCVVKNKDMGDLFPIVFHDGIVEPATNAAQYVLQSAK